VTTEATGQTTRQGYKGQMGSKGLWRHVEGTAVAPKPYAVVNGELFLSDLKTAAMEEQMEAKESKISRKKRNT